MTFEALHPALVVESVVVAVAVHLGARRVGRPVGWVSLGGLGAVVAVIVAVQPPIVADGCLLVLAALACLVPGATMPPWVAAAGTVACCVGLVATAPVVPGAPATRLLMACAGPLAVLLAMLADRLSPRVMLVLLVIASAGIWATVADTEGALAVGLVLGVGMVVSLLWDPAAEPPAADWSTLWVEVARWMPLCEALTWAVTDGGRGRPPGLIGAAGCVVAVLIAGAGFGRRAPRRGRGEWWWSAGAVGVATAMVGVASRCAGLRPTLGGAALALGWDLGIGAIVVIVAVAARDASRPRLPARQGR